MAGKISPAAVDANAAVLESTEDAQLQPDLVTVLNGTAAKSVNNLR